MIIEEDRHQVEKETLEKILKQDVDYGDEESVEQLKYAPSYNHIYSRDKKIGSLVDNPQLTTFHRDDQVEKQSIEIEKSTIKKDMSPRYRRSTVEAQNKQNVIQKRIDTRVMVRRQVTSNILMMPFSNEDLNFSSKHHSLGAEMSKAGKKSEIRINDFESQSQSRTAFQLNSQGDNTTNIQTSTAIGLGKLSAINNVNINSSEAQAIIFQNQQLNLHDNMPIESHTQTQTGTSEMQEERKFEIPVVPFTVHKNFMALKPQKGQRPKSGNRIDLADDRVTMYVGNIPELDEEIRSEMITRQDLQGTDVEMIRSEYTTKILSKTTSDPMSHILSMDFGPKELISQKKHHELKELFDLAAEPEETEKLDRKSLFKKFEKVSQNFLHRRLSEREKFDIVKSLPVSINAKTTEQRLYMQQYEDTFKIPKYSPHKYLVLNQGLSTVNADLIPKDKKYKKPLFENPKIKLRQFQIEKGYDLSMDARETIYKYNDAQLSKQQLQRRMSSMSPIKRKQSLNSSKNTTLRKVTTYHSNGNLETAFSHTQRLLSGHNTPIPQNKRTLLDQIKKDQDQLQDKLKNKLYYEEINSIKSSKLFFNFKNKLSFFDMPQQKDYQRIQNAIDEAKQSMERHKLKPLHRSQSFHSWRSTLEKRMDEGNSMADQEEPVGIRMPRSMRKHMTMLLQKQLSETKSQRMITMNSQNSAMQGESYIETGGFESEHNSDLEEMFEQPFFEEQNQSKEFEIEPRIRTSRVDRGGSHLKRQNLVEKIRQKLALKANKKVRDNLRKAVEKQDSIQNQSMDIKLHQRYETHEGSKKILGSLNSSGTYEGGPLRLRIANDVINSGSNQSYYEHPQGENTFYDANISSEMDKPHHHLLRQDGDMILQGEPQITNQKTSNMLVQDFKNGSGQQSQTKSMNSSERGRRNELELEFREKEEKEKRIVKQMTITAQQDLVTTLNPPSLDLLEQFKRKRNFSNFMTIQNKPDIAGVVSYSQDNTNFSNGVTSGKHSKQKSSNFLHTGNQFLSQTIKNDESLKSSTNKNKILLSNKSSLRTYRKNVKSNQMYGYPTNKQFEELPQTSENPLSGLAGSIAMNPIHNFSRHFLRTGSQDEMNSTKARHRFINSLKPKTAKAGNRNQFKQLDRSLSPVNALSGLGDPIVENGINSQQETRLLQPETRFKKAAFTLGHTAKESSRQSSQVISPKEAVGRKATIKPIWAQLVRRIAQYGIEKYRQLSSWEQTQLGNDFKAQIMMENVRTRKLLRRNTNTRNSDQLIQSLPVANGDSKQQVSVNNGTIGIKGRGLILDSFKKGNENNKDISSLADLNGSGSVVHEVLEADSNKSYIIGQNGRKYKPFASIERYSTIPVNLEPQFEQLANTLDLEAANQFDFLKKNKDAVADPLSLKLTQLGTDIHHYRRNPSSRHPKHIQLFYQTQLQFKNTSNSEAVRQCDCHQMLAKHKDNQELNQMIAIKKNKLKGINSQVYNSVEVATNLRMKPRHSIEKTQRMLGHFKQQDYQEFTERYHHLKNRMSHMHLLESNDSIGNTFMTQALQGNSVPSTVLLKENMQGRNRPFLEHMAFQQTLQPNNIFADDKVDPKTVTVNQANTRLSNLLMESKHFHTEVLQSANNEKKQEQITKWEVMNKEHRKKLNRLDRKLNKVQSHYL